MADRATRCVGLSDLAHRDRSLHPSLDTLAVQEVLQRQAIHDCPQHAHVVGPRTIHPALGKLSAAEVVPAADDHGNLCATSDNIGDLPRDGGHDVRIDAKSATASECFTGELEQHPAPP